MTSAPYWVPLGAAPRTAQVWYGSTPPPSPVDGDEWVFPADATNGVMWRFRYRAASASAYKWEFIGGAPLYGYNAGPNSMTGTNPADLGGPNITAPRSGDYMVTFTADGYVTPGPANLTFGLRRVTSGLGPALDDAVSIRPQTSANDSATSGRTLKATAVPAGEVLSIWGYTTTGTATFRWRGLAVTPIRVS